MGMRFRVNGVTYDFDFGAVSARLAKEVRDAAGDPITKFLEPPYDAVSFAVMAFAAERAAKRRASLDAMLDSFTMDAILKGMAELAEMDEAEAAAAEAAAAAADPPTTSEAAYEAVAADPETLALPS